MTPAVLVGVTLWRLAIVGCALYGFSDATGWSANFEGLSQQASLATGIIYLGLLAYPAFTGGRRHEPRSPWFRGATTVLLLLVTGTFFGVMGGDLDYLPFEHIYTPLIVLVDWLFVGRNQAAAKWWHPLTWIAFPLAYFTYFLAGGIYQSLYSFLDPDGEEFALMVGGLLLGVVAVGYLLYGAAKLKGAVGGANTRHFQENSPMTYHDPRGHRPPPPPQQPPRGPYGPPPGPPYPPPGPQWQHPAPRPDGKRTQWIAITAIVAVAVVAAAAGVWLWTRDGDSTAGPDTPASQDYTAGVESVGAAEVAWQVEQGPAPVAVGADDHWVTDEHLVRRLPGRVVAYELKTGKQAWELPVGKIDDDRCPSSVEHSDLRVALLIATGDKSPQTCEKLTVVDIGTGKALFTADLPRVEREPVRIDVPVVFGENVVIPNRAGTRVLDIGDGAVRSMPKPDAACKSTKAALFGDLLLAQAECDNGEESGIRLRSFDKNLKMVWEWATPKGADGEPLPVLGVLSLDPLVVELGHSGSDTQLARVDPKSGAMVRISEYTGGVRGKYMSACDGWAMGTCEMAKVVGGKVILTTVAVHVNPGAPEAAPGMESTDHRNELVAFDLDTGEEAWRTGIVAGRTLSMVATADGSVAAYQPENRNGGMGILFSVNPDTGKLAPLMPIGPQAHGDDRLNDHVRSYTFRGDNQLAYWRDGLLIIFKGVHRASTTGDPDTVAFTLP